MSHLDKVREGYQNAFYRSTALYIATIVTLIFVLQVHRYFFDLPADQARCNTTEDNSTSNASLIPLIGVFFDG